MQIATKPTATTAGLLAIALGLGGCVDVKDFWGTDTGVECDQGNDTDALADTGGTECQSTGNLDDELDVKAHCVRFDSSDFGDAPTHIAPPGCYAPYNTGADPTSTIDYGCTKLSLTADLYLICEETASIGDYTYDFTAGPGMTCGDYTDFEHDFIIAGPGGLYQLEHDPAVVINGWECPIAYQFNAMPAAYIAASGPTACTPGSAIFDTVALHAVEEGPDGAIALNVLPLAQSNTPFPERAWLRSVTVNSWPQDPQGTSKLHIAQAGQQLTFNADGSISGGHEIDPAVSTTLALPIGGAVMSANFGIDHYERGDGLPTVTLGWTCEVDPQSPHYQPLVDNDGYLADLSAYGVQHPFVFWVDETHHMVRIAPMGRFQDAVSTQYDAQGNFKTDLRSLNTTLEGKIDPSGVALHLEVARITVHLDPPLVQEVLNVYLPPL